MEFKVGDKAVYPNRGVGVIRAVETKNVREWFGLGEDVDLEEEDVTVYILKILDNGGEIEVPVDNASALGLRQVVTKEHVEKVYDVLRDRDVPTDNQTWNRRYREYMTKIATGDPVEVAKVLRDLALLKKEKNLSFGERKMYDQAHGLLVQEVAVAKDLDEKTIEGEIEKIFLK